MDHAVTIGAQKAKIADLCFVAGLQRVDGFGVMAFYEAVAMVPITLAEVKPAGFARQLTKHVAGNRRFESTSLQRRVACEPEGFETAPFDRSGPS